MVLPFFWAAPVRPEPTSCATMGPCTDVRICGFTKHLSLLEQRTSSKTSRSRPLVENGIRDNHLMLISDIDHVQLAAPPGCEAQARYFFCQLLQLKEIEKPEPLRSGGGCWFQVGSRQLHIGVEEEFRPAAKAHPADPNVLFTSLEEAGVRCVWDESVPDLRRFLRK